MASGPKPLLLLALALAGCGQNDPEHPANATLNCDGASQCIGTPPVGGGGKDGGVLTDAAVEGGTAVAVGGTIVELTSDDFFASTPFTTPAKVRFEGATGVPVEGEYDGTKFSVSGVLAGPAVWATVTPSTAAALPTVQPADTTSGAPLELAVVPGATISLIYSVITASTVLDLGRSHVVLRFIDAAGKPLTGVSVDHGSDVVAYDTAGSWSDLANGTGPLGLAVVVNVNPGGDVTQQSFQFTHGGDSAGVPLQLEPDSVTIADVRVSP